ncbi:MAG: MATE family efflux transporter [Geminicoccales bacterium]
MERSLKIDAIRAGWADEATHLVRLSWPIVLTNLGGILIQTTDVVMIGWLGSEELAAAALATNIRFILFLFSIGVIAAISPMMAQSLGRRRHNVRDVRRTVRQGLWVAFVVGLPASVMLWRIDLILAWLRQDPELIALATSYTRVAVFGFLPSLIFVVLRNFIAALERPAAAMVVSIVCILFNALADYGLIFGKFGLPQLGLVGAGWATSFSEFFLLIGLLSFILLDRQFRRFRIFGRFWRPDWQRFIEIWRLGLPIAIALMMETGLFASAGFLMGWIGTVELAAHQIALQCAATTFMVPLGLSQAATIRVGLAVGMNNPLAVYRAGMTAIVLGVLFMAIMAAIMLTWPESIVALFLDDANPSSASVASFAATLLILAAFFQIFDAGQVVGMGCLRGLKDTRTPMVCAMISYWGIGLSCSAGLAFGFGLGGVGIWIGLIVALAVAAALLILRFIRQHARLMGSAAG